MMGNDKTENAAGRRISSLLDAGSFIEIGGAVTLRNTDFQLKQQEAPADGVRTGYGLIDGNLVYVYSQDVSVLGGSIGEMHAKKIAGIYELAMKTGAPVIGLIDCAGLRLQEAADALEALGRLYHKQAMASGVIPQITGIFGNCGGGLALIPALTDFTFMETKGRLFVNAPNAILENRIEKNDTSDAVFQSRETGLADITGTEEEILAQMRRLISFLPANNEETAAYESCQDDLNRRCDAAEALADDAAWLMREMADLGDCFEVKKEHAKDMVTGFIRLAGNTVGVVGNRKRIIDEEGNTTEEFKEGLSAKGALKAAEFVEFCDAFQIPVCTLTNVSGFSNLPGEERHLAKHTARLVYALSNATVPKVNVITKEAYGSAYTVMNSKSVGADMVFAWEDAGIGMMDAALAAKIMYPEEGAAVLKEKEAAYRELQNSPLSAARRGYVDTLIAPEETRKYVIGAMEMLFTKREERPLKKHGTV